MNKTLNTLGLANRAGKVITGEDHIIKSIRNKTAKLIVLGSDAGVNTTKKILDKAKFYEVEVYRELTIDEISQAIGKINRVALSITDNGFKKIIMKR